MGGGVSVCGLYSLLTSASDSLARLHKEVTDGTVLYRGK